MLSFFTVALLVMTFVGCTSLPKQDAKASAGVQPLWVEGDTRDKIIVLSDLHTGFEDAYAEILENRPYLIEFLQRIAVTSDVREVVLNGDILDDIENQILCPDSLLECTGHMSPDTLRNPEVEASVPEGKSHVS